MAARIVDAFIFLREAGDDSVGGLQPRLDLDTNPDRVARTERFRDLRRQPNAVGGTGGRHDRCEHVPGQLVIEALARDDAFNDGRRNSLVEDLISDCLATNQRNQPLNHVLSLPDTDK